MCNLSSNKYKLYKEFVKIVNYDVMIWRNQYLNLVRVVRRIKLMFFNILQYFKFFTIKKFYVVMNHKL